MITLLLDKIIYAIFIMKKGFYFKKLHFMTITMPVKYSLLILTTNAMWF